MRKKIVIGLLVLGSSLFAEKSVPVMVGGDSDFDACGGTGIIKGLKVNGDGFLAVRKGPDSKYKMIDKLYNGNNVWLCDTKGKWEGVVYGKNCGVGGTIPKRQKYSGQCKSGWIYGK
ncbi:integron, partial [Poseidonibacter ostreae]